MSATTSTSADQHASARWLLVSAVTVAAAAHVPVIGPHLDEAPYMGVLFMLLTGACLAIGATVAVADATWGYGAALPVCGAAVIGYAATRLVAFPQLADDVGNWFEPLGVVSVLSETVVVVVAALVVRRRSAAAR
jgi:hypothetical protein